MLGADDVRDGFDNVHLKLFCWRLPLDSPLEAAFGGTFSCSAETASR